MGKVTPGFNKNINLHHFDSDEADIIRRFASEQYITNSGKKLFLSETSEYKFFLFKPIDSFSDAFNLELEIIVLFSNYQIFEPRTLDAFHYIYRQFEEYRLEKICSVLISRDTNIEARITDLIRNDPESPNIIPFTYAELLQTKGDSFFIRNRFRKYLYSRDLFDFSSPLKKDLYFYGRSKIINDILNRHKANENFGIFGLRRTGKTSIVFGVQRAISKIDSISVIIDCQNTSFSNRRWNKALFYIITELKKQNNIDIVTNSETAYSNENAGICFENDISKIYEYNKNKKILIAFDEIERITFNIASFDHWKIGKDFIYFWQTIRSIYQKTDYFTILISGTNPNCIEQSIILNDDNPLFNQISYIFIPGFDISQVREMVRKLGRIMGIKFQETIYTHLVEDFGGHPFLIRQFCSLINKQYPDRPFDVSKNIYLKIKEKFSEKTEYIKMIIGVLEENYKDEYSLLQYLARGDEETFNNFAIELPEMVRHLIGYGIIIKVNNSYCFQIEEIKNYILRVDKYKKIVKTDEERWAEVSERRNDLEVKLRKLIKQVLFIGMEKQNAFDIVVSNLNRDDDKKKAKLLSYNDLFNPNKNNIYFSSLISIIEGKWTLFENVFSQPKSEIIEVLRKINRNRVDAHAKEITENDFNYLRACFDMIEEKISDFL